MYNIYIISFSNAERERDAYLSISPFHFPLLPLFPRVFVPSPTATAMRLPVLQPQEAAEEFSHRTR